MQQSDEISNFNSLVIKAFASSQDSLNLLSQFPINESSLLLLIDVLFCDDLAICCEKTKYVSMKILTNFFENNFSINVADRLQNYYDINFKSDKYNSSLISSSFSIDLFASIFKRNPPYALHLLNDLLSIGADRYHIGILYAVRFVKKIQTTSGFENILLSIFNHLPEMIQTLNEMLSIIPITKLLLPVIVSQKTHLELFKYYNTSKFARDALINLLQLNFLFERYDIFNAFVLEYINVFDDIITNDQQLLWKSDLLNELRRTDPFRNLPFDSFFINLIQKIFASLEFSFNHFDQSIETINNFLSFFGKIDQLSCNSHFDGALAFSHDVMNKCRMLIMNNISRIEFNGINEINSPISSFFDQCANLFIYDYINSMSNLSKLHSLASFEIIKKMILTHENKQLMSYIEFIEIDKHSFISFFSLNNKPIDFMVDYLNAFISIYNPASNFIVEYFQALIILIQNLQAVQNIDLQVLRSAADCIDKIQIIDENQFLFLISNPFFPFIGQKEHRKEMKKIFQKFSNLSFIDKIVNTIISTPNLNPEIILDYLKYIPLNLLFDAFFPVFLNEFIPKIDPVIISNFIYAIVKRIKEAYFPTMSELLITYIKLVCHVLDNLVISNAENIFVQKKIMKSLTVIFQIPSLNIGVFMFYKDFFIPNLIEKNIESLNSISPEIICRNGIKFLIVYFQVFCEKLDCSSGSLLSDNAVVLFLKIVLYQIQINETSIDLLNDIFNILVKLIESNRIEKINGLTDTLLNECVKKGSKGKLPLAMYLSISYLFKLHPKLFSRFVKSINTQENPENSKIESIANSIINGSKNQIINASQIFFGLLAENFNSIFSVPAV